MFFVAHWTRTTTTGGSRAHPAPQPRRALRPRRRRERGLLHRGARLPGQGRRCPARPSCRPRARPTTTTSACSPIGAGQAPRRPGAAPSGSTTWPGRSTPSPSWSGSPTVLTERGALVGASDHGTTKALYAHDPDGLEFEVSWLVPAELLTPDLTMRTVAARPGRRDRPLRRRHASGASACRYRCRRNPPSRLAYRLPRAGILPSGRWLDSSLRWCADRAWTSAECAARAAGGPMRMTGDTVP